MHLGRSLRRLDSYAERLAGRLALTQSFVLTQSSALTQSLALTDSLKGTRKGTSPESKRALW